MASAELKRAARHILDAARDGADIHRDAITRALRISGNLTEDNEEDEDPIVRSHRAAGEWERSGIHNIAPATWLCGLGGA